MRLAIKAFICGGIASFLASSLLVAQTSLDHAATFASGGGKVLSSSYSGVSVLAGHLAGDVHESSQYRNRSGPIGAFVHLLTADRGSAPIAIAGNDQAIECSGGDGELVTLDGSASSDPDGVADIVGFEWRLGEEVIGTEAVIEVTVPVGEHEIVLEVTDASGLSHEDSTLVTIQDTLAPELTLVGEDRIVLRENVHTYVELGAEVDDVCDSEIEFVIGGDVVDPAVIGTYTVTYDATDVAGNAALQLTRTIQVVSANEIVVELRDSHGVLIPQSGATLAYQPNSEGDYVPFGDGQLREDGQAIIAFESGRHRFQLTYQGATQTIRQRVDENPIIVFQTVLAVVELRDSTGALIEGSTEPVEWRPGNAGDFVPFGDGNVAEGGMESLEVLGLKHGFRLTFQGAAQTITQNVSENSVVLFLTSGAVDEPGTRIELRDSLGNLIVDSGSSIEYQPNSSGDYVSFGGGVLEADGTVTMDVLAQNHRFRLTYQDASQVIRQHVGENPVVVFQTQAVSVTFSNSAGDLIQDSGATVTYQPGNAGDYVPFGDGLLDVGASEVQELLAVKHRFSLGYQGAVQTQQQDIAESAEVVFQTVQASVELRDSAGELIEGSSGTVEWRPGNEGDFGPFGDGSVEEGGAESLEVLGVRHRFRLTHDKGTQALTQNVGELATVLFQTAPATVELRDSVGELIDNSGALVSWKPAGAEEFQSFDTGSLGEDGSSTQEVLPVKHAFRLEFEGAVQTQQQDIGENVAVVFQTAGSPDETGTFIELRDSQGNLIVDSGATIEYQPNSSGDYVPFGDGLLESDGTEAMDVLAQNHRFRLTYQGASQVIRQHVGENSVVVFQTQVVSVTFWDAAGELLLDSGAVVSYQPGSAGDYVPFGDGALDVGASESRELLPVKHRFRLGYQGAEQTQQQDVAESTEIVFQTVLAVVELRDSAGALIEGSTGLVEWRPGNEGDFVLFGDGNVEDGGTEALEVLGVSHRFRLVYDNGTQALTQNVGEQETVLFQTAPATVELRDSAGELIDNSGALVSWKPAGAEEFQSFDTGSLGEDGSSTQEVLPVKHAFRLEFEGAVQTQQQDIGENVAVVFQTAGSPEDVGTLVEIRDSQGNLIVGSGATIEYQPNSSGYYVPFGDGIVGADGTVFMDVLPQRHRFRLTYSGATQVIRQNVGETPVVVFQTVPLMVELRDSLGELMTEADAMVEIQPGREGDYLPFNDGGFSAGVAGPLEQLPVRHRFRLTYLGASQILEQDAAEDPIAVFQTVLALVELRDSVDALIASSGGLIDWQPGKEGDYVPFSGGSLEDDGTARLEVLGVGHRFRVSYDQATRVVTQNVQTASTILFQTVAATIELRDHTGALIQNSAAELTWKPVGAEAFFGLGSGLIDDSGQTHHEVLPGRHAFRLLLAGADQVIRHDVGMDPVVLFQTAGTEEGLSARIELRDSEGDLITDSSAIVQYQPDRTGDYVDFGDGLLDASGREFMDVLAVKHRFRLTYLGATQTFVQDLAENAVVLFQTERVTVAFENSQGDPIVDPAATIAYQPGSAGDYLAFGDGVFEDSNEDYLEILPIKHRFRIGFQGAFQTRQQDVSLDAQVLFQTSLVSVELRDSHGDLLDESDGSVLWRPGNEGDYVAFGDGSLEQGGSEQLEALGVNHGFRVVLDGGRQTITQNTGEASTVLFQTELATVELRNSTGSLIENAVALVAWKPAGAEEFAAFDSGLLGANGTIQREVLPVKHHFRLTFAGASQTLQQDVGENAVVLFQTSGSGEAPGVRVELRDSAGQLIVDSGATIEYQPNSSGNYVPFGTGLVDAAGVAIMEILPLEHRFRLSYGGAAQVIRQDVGISATVLFQTVASNVELKNSLGDLIVGSGATIDYQPGSNGDYLPLGNRSLDTGLSESVEMLPVKHRFRATHLDASQVLQQDLSLGSLVSFQTVSVQIELRDSEGVLIENSDATVAWRPGNAGDFVDLGDGVLDPSGTESFEVLGLKHRFRITYEAAVLTITQDVSEHSTVLFQTVLVTVELRDESGDLVEGTDASVLWKPAGAGAFQDFGDALLGANGNLGHELLPSNHRFRIIVDGDIETRAQNVAIDPVVVFVPVPALVHASASGLGEHSDSRLQLIQKEGKVVILVSGKPMSRASLEWSVDFELWLPMQEIQLNRFGTLEIEDAEAFRYPLGFYRVITETDAETLLQSR